MPPAVALHRPGPWRIQGFTGGVQFSNSGDITPPVTVFVSETTSRVSLVTGFTDTHVSWSADEDCQAWQIRDVTGTGQTVADGVLVASGGAVSANVGQDTVVSGATLSSGDALKTLKIFAQDLAGNWTT